MDNIKIGDRLQIQCYKHNERVHRAWNEAVVLDIQKDYIVFGNNRTLVTEAEGTRWRTKEPAVMYFFFDKWYNIIVQLKREGVFYYCNIASPFIIEDYTIKYIDYDLDLRIFPSGEYKILDQQEYNYHKKLMRYGKDLDSVIRNSLVELIKEYKDNALMFDKETNFKYYNIYRGLKKDKKVINLSQMKKS